MTNNSHVLIKAVDSLITCFTALKMKHSDCNTSDSNNISSDIVLNQFDVEKKKFVECAGYILFIIIE